MDPINLIAGLNIIAAFAANAGAKKGLRSSVIGTKEKPKSYLQAVPLTLSVLTLVALIIAVFQLGTFGYKISYQSLRISGLAVYIIFSWIQIWAYKAMGSNYAQEILILKIIIWLKKGLSGLFAIRNIFLRFYWTSAPA